MYKASRQGIQRLEVFDTEEQFLKQNANKIIALTDCLKVAPAPQKQQPNVFEVRTSLSFVLSFHSIQSFYKCNLNNNKLNNNKLNLHTYKQTNKHLNI